MGKEQVSVVLPTYNRGDRLLAAIDSVLNQTYREIELIVVDDGSTDHTRELMESYRDERVRYVSLDENQGASAARNYGIAQCSGKYIAFEDSDDLWYPTKLEKQMEVLLNSESEVGFVYHKIVYNMGQNRRAVLPAEQIPIDKKSGDIYDQLFYDNLIPCPSILAKRECIAEAGGFDTGLPALEDYDYAIKMAKSWKAVFLDEILLEAGYSADGVSVNSGNYLLASCQLLGRYKEDYLRTGYFDRRVERIVQDAKQMGVLEQILQYMEKVLQL